MKTMFKNEESGRSMVEMLGVLAIVGVLSVGGIAGYSQAMSKFKMTKAMDQVQTIITNIRTLYASQRTYTALTASQAFALGILTEESYNSDNSGSGLNPFGGAIEFGVGNTVGEKRTFTVTYKGLTSEACVKMATADWGADQSSGLITMKVAGGTEKAFKWANMNLSGTFGTLPVSITDAAGACGTEQKGSVTWEYR